MNTNNFTYDEFIENIIKSRGRHGCGNEYHEKHHIKPKCLGGENIEENYIDLYAKEHFIAHKLLAKENPHNSKLQYAWWMMCHVKDKSQERYECTPEEYEESRKTFVNLRKNTKASKETKEKMSKAHAGKNNSFYGKHHTQQSREKIKEARKKQIMRKGFHWSKEIRKHMAEGHKGLQQNGDHPRAKKVACDNQIFSCIKLCAEYYGIIPNTMRAWLQGRNPMPEKFQNLGLKYFEGD